MAKSKVTNEQILKKLEVMKQESSLSSVDNVLLSTMFFVITFYFALFISKDFILSLIKTPPIFIIFLYLFPLILLALPASISIIFTSFIKKERFNGRLQAINLISLGTFLTISILISWTIMAIFSFNSKYIAYSLMAISFLTSFLINYFIICPKIIRFFQSNYPDLYKETPIKINKFGQYLMGFTSKAKRDKKGYSNTFRLFLIILFIVSILLYLWTTNFIETKKLYPIGEEWFTLGLSYYSDNMSCIDFDKVPLTYFNNNQIINASKQSPNWVRLNLYFRVKCNFNKAHISISATNLSWVHLNNPSNLSYVNETENKNSEVIVDYNQSDSNSYYQGLDIFLAIDNDFFNYYRFIGSERIRWWSIDFEYKDSIFGGYYADENSFFILEGNLKKESPIFRGKHKEFEFNDTHSIILRFNPKSKGWSLLQKVLDGVFAGLIAVLIYELLKEIVVRKKNTNN